MKIPGISGLGEDAADAPPVVRYSFLAWNAVATIGLIDAVLLYSAKQAQTDAAIKANPTVNPAEVADIVGDVLLTFLIAAIVLGLAYVYFGYRARAGLRSGRTVVTSLAVVNLLFRYYFGLTIFGLLAVLVAAAAVVMLFTPGANAYFKQKQ